MPYVKYTQIMGEKGAKRIRNVLFKKGMHLAEAAKFLKVAYNSLKHRCKRMILEGSMTQEEYESEILRDRRVHKKSFKAKAIAKVRAGKKLSSVAAKYNIHPEMLRNWVKETHG